jgi:hypothetical protein
VWVGSTPWCVRTTHYRWSASVGGVIATVEWARLRGRCEQLVEDLLQQTGVPRPWDINDFLDRLERYRGRDIDLCAVTWTVGSSTGAWQRRQDYDLIAYPENTSGFHQDHVILHEIGHVISAHEGQCVLTETEAQRLAPHLAPAALAHLLNRSSSDVEEHEAELIAMLIYQRAQNKPLIGRDVPDRAARMADIFGA